MAQTLTPEHLQRLLLQNECSLSLVARDLGVSPQRVSQLCTIYGVKVTKDAVLVEPTKKTLLYPTDQVKLPKKRAPRN